MREGLRGEVFDWQSMKKALEKMWTGKLIIFIFVI